MVRRMLPAGLQETGAYPSPTDLADRLLRSSKLRPPKQSAPIPNAARRSAAPPRPWSTSAQRSRRSSPPRWPSPTDSVPESACSGGSRCAHVALWVCTQSALMDAMGIREARARLAQLAGAASAGRRVLITRHGQPVAVLLPVEAAAVWERAQAAQAEPAQRTAEAAAQEAAEQDVIGTPAAVVLRTYLQEDDGRRWWDHLMLENLAEPGPATCRCLREPVAQRLRYIREEVLDLRCQEGRPQPDSRPFGWRDGPEFDELAAGCRLGMVDAEGALLAQAGYDGAAHFLPDPEAGPEW